MNKQTRQDLEAYYREAGTWANERQGELLKSRRIAWLFAAGAALVAVLEAIALVVLMPLKTVQPYTLLVDRHTGYVQAVQPLEAQRISGDAALTQSFLVQYVIARESFDIDSVQADYRRVAAWSAESARSGYTATMQASSPQSPLATLPRSSVIETQVKSVSPVARNVAMVRFDTQRRDAGGEPQPPRSWVAMIRYRYSGQPLSQEERFINPLGFQVLRYRRDAEALAAAPVDNVVTEAPKPAIVPRPQPPSRPPPPATRVPEPEL